MQRKTREYLVTLVEIAIFGALSMLIDYFIPTFGTWKISFKMLPILILAFRRGLIPGVLGGLLWGLLQILLGEAYILNFIQVLIEYILAFAVIGLAGVFSKKIQASLYQVPVNKRHAMGWVSLGTLLGSFVRYFFHFIAGFIFWGEENMGTLESIIFSLGVNGKDFLLETATCLVIILLLAPFYEQILRVRNRD